MSSPEAGPSTPSKPLFKKRASKAVSRTRLSSSVIDDADNPAASTAADEEEPLSVQELIALRTLSRKPTGIELDRLNKGERRKRKPNTTQTHQDNDDSSDDDVEDQPRRLVRKNNFQGETGTVDVDKHMMAYIEAEMAKRTGTSTASSADTVRSALANPHDQLYALAEEYRALQRQIKPDQTQDEREGNVALSAAMLSSIPEVDLGIDERMKNIQHTEDAKRALAERAKAANADGLGVDTAFAGARFQQASGSNSRQMATDQLVLDRFRKRQRTFR
ncbi:uncharacterized protein SRS1_16422 [Sporisorium reilianum f. sp. reilianum]|uniref:Hepatocellular carcinoma-associated antigen 59-domain-containing protein n=1 Tax=Sporisorium reilianum f. sp. reilianum TaxID=72559 RepID=A0A2N8UM28_9BASI|nr:uncharacterized protein SRS1_16422 [Sporisorium reilianum f. sp. reilianum]